MRHIQTHAGTDEAPLAKDSAGTFHSRQRATGQLIQSQNVTKYII